MLERIVAALGRSSSAVDLQALCADLVRENDALRLENAKLKAENRQLRRRLHDRELARLRRAESDCAMLGALHYAGLQTTAKAAADYGISKRAWIAACGLLNLAHIRMKDGRWRDIPLEEYEAALRATVALVEREGLTIWTARMAKNGSRGLHVTNPRPSERHAHNRAPNHAQSAMRDAPSGVPIAPVSGEVVGLWSVERIDPYQ